MSDEPLGGFKSGCGCTGTVLRLAFVGAAVFALFVTLVVASSACAPVDGECGGETRCGEGER